MKFDKETILKQRFWFLLAVAVPLTLAVFFILMTSVRAGIAANKKKLDGDLNSAGSGGDIKNQFWVKQMEEKAEKMAAEEEKVWKEAYSKQVGISTWPKSIERDFRFKDGYFATEIKVERSKDKKSPEKFPPNDDSHFHGVVKSHNKDKVVVLGEKVKEKDNEITFQTTAKIKVSGEKIAYFRDLEDGDRVAVTFIRSKYFFDPLTESEQKAFIQEAGYKSQIPEILEQVNPVNAKGQGVVQLHNWPYPYSNKPTLNLPPAGALFFRYVAKDWNDLHDISDEAWMAQEDLWVQREIYRIIREANDSVSIFTSKDFGDAKGNSPQKYIVKNPYWELTLTLAGKKKLGLSIKNLLPRRQRLDLDFLIKLQKEAKQDQFEKITIGGEPLGPLEARDLNEHDVQGRSATGIYAVEQAIDWETAAVKRIDHISFGALGGGDCAHGHRTFPVGLKAFREKKGKEAAPPQPGPGGNFDPKMKMPDMKKGSGDAGITPNGLKSDRYIEPPSRQTRRIPVGVAMIVDQQHVDRVLLAFSKSSLRFLTTQVILNRYPHSVRPQVGTTQPGGKGFNPKGFGGDGALGPGQFGGFRQQTASAGSSDQESNVELVIYGIVTLYERYPPRAQTP